MIPMTFLLTAQNHFSDWSLSKVPQGHRLIQLQNFVVRRAYLTLINILINKMGDFLISLLFLNLHLEQKLQGTSRAAQNTGRAKLHEALPSPLHTGCRTLRQAWLASGPAVRRGPGALSTLRVEARWGRRSLTRGSLLLDTLATDRAS